MRNYKIAVIAGDGIGIEVTEVAIKILSKVAKKYNCRLLLKELLVGGCAVDQYGAPLPEDALAECQQSDAVLLGAIGGPKWDSICEDKRPEKALLGLRAGLKLYANLRPIKVYRELASASPLKNKIVNTGVDLLIVRELTGGIYFGVSGRKNVGGYSAAYDTETYNELEITRITKIAFEAAIKRRKKITLVDKANILESSRFWREVIMHTAKNYPEIKLDYMYVDNAAMQIVKNPSQFDVIVTSNMFGDILSDVAAVITGSIGMLPSASTRDDDFGMFEPVHGTAPDIAGKGIANPIAQILSVGMLFEHSLKMHAAARDIEAAVARVLKNGYRTADILTKNCQRVSTKEMGEIILREL